MYKGHKVSLTLTHGSFRQWYESDFALLMPQTVFFKEVAAISNSQSCSTNLGDEPFLWFYEYYINI